MIAFYPDSKQTVPRDQNITKVCTGSIFDLLAEKDMHTVLTHSYDTISTDPLTVALFVNELNKRNVTLKLVDDAKTPQLDKYMNTIDMFRQFRSKNIGIKTKEKLSEMKKNKREQAKYHGDFELKIIYWFLMNMNNLSLIKLLN